MYVPEWGRVHQADAEASGDERREVRVEFCPTHREASRAGRRHMRTLQPIHLGTKKRRQKRSRCMRNILCRLTKKEGCICDMSPFLLGSRKDDSLYGWLASPSGFEPLLTA